jgi:hypothetical protein
MFTLLTFMLSNMMPHSEISAWPLLGKLYLFNAVMLTFSLLFSSFIINLSQTHHNKSVPNWLKIVCSFVNLLFIILIYNLQLVYD